VEDRVFKFIDDTWAVLNDYNGYAGYKPNKSNAGDGSPLEGCAIFYNNKRFERVKSNYGHRPYLGGTPAAIYTVFNLRDKETKQLLWVFSLDLTEGSSGNEQRKKEIEEVLTYIKRLPLRQQQQQGSTVSDAVLLCGNFNSAPNAEVHKIIQGDKAVNLESAFDLNTTPYTLFTENLKILVDFVFMTKGVFDKVKLTTFTCKKQLPNPCWPSDHFPLVADLAMRD